LRRYLEKALHKKKAGGVAEGVSSELNPQYWGKKKIGSIK
jgi:hypothetical protein